MSIPRSTLLAVCMAVFPLFPRLATAQTSFDGTVEVANVRFERVRPDWYQIEVEVDVKAAPGNTSRYVNRVQASLNLGFKITAGGDRFEFYRANATAVTIEQGRANFRFYLPPEVVDRDRLSGAADYWAVDLAVAGKAVPRSAKQVSSSLPNPTALESFLSKVSSEGATNDGILIPQFQSPFAWAQGGQGAPSFLRSPEQTTGR